MIITKNKWKSIKIERDDIQKIEPIADWTFSTSYLGSIEKLSDSKLSKYFPDLCQKQFSAHWKPSDQQLPISRLGPDNPILKYMEVNLYVDELCDNGVSEGKFR